MSATLTTTPAKSKEESVALVTTPAVLVDELTDPPTPPETTDGVRSATELGISEMGQSTSILYSGLCGEYSLQPRRPQAVPLQP